jgi:hypothetical protein
MGAALLLTAAPAFAGDPPASGDASAPAAPTTPAPAATASTGDAMAGEHPMAVVDQSYVVGKGKIGAAADLSIITLSVTGPMGMGSASFTQEGIHIAGQYGLIDKLGVGIDYAAPLAGDGTDNTAGKGPLTFFGAYAIKDDAKMHIAASAGFTANLCGAVDMTGSCSVTKSIHAGLGARYNLTPQLALFTGSPFGPGLPGAVTSFAGTGEHLNISLESSGPITLAIPVGIGYQATPQIFAFAEPVLANIYLSNAPMGADSAQFYFSDGLGAPTVFGAYYAVNKSLNVGANLFDDLKHAGDLYAISLGARWFN